MRHEPRAVIAYLRGDDLTQMQQKNFPDPELAERWLMTVVNSRETAARMGGGL